MGAERGREGMYAMPRRRLLCLRLGILLPS